MTPLSTRACDTGAPVEEVNDDPLTLEPDDRGPLRSRPHPVTGSSTNRNNVTDHIL